MAVIYTESVAGSFVLKYSHLLLCDVQITALLYLPRPPEGTEIKH